MKNILTLALSLALTLGAFGQVAQRTVEPKPLYEAMTESEIINTHRANKTLYVLQNATDVESETIDGWIVTSWVLHTRRNRALMVIRTVNPKTGHIFYSMYKLLNNG